MEYAVNMNNNNKISNIKNKYKKKLKLVLHISGESCIFQTIDNMGCRLMARRLTVNQVIGGSSPSVPAKAGRNTVGFFT